MSAARGRRVWLVEEFGHGGIGRYAVDVANLIGPAADTVVATTDSGPVGGLHGRSVTWFPRGADGRLGKARGALAGLVRAVRCTRRRDVAWVPLGIRPVYEFLLVAALRARGAVVVATVHNRAPHGSTRDSPLVVNAARRAGRVVVHTDAMEAWATERRMSVARLPFPPPDIAAGASASGGPDAGDVDLELPAGHLIVAFLGYLHAYKGPDVLLRALAEARRQEPELPVHVLMAGKAPDEPDLPALVESLGIGPAVTLRQGWLEEATMVRLLGAADVLALPYRRIDNSGMAALGRQFRIPAVASDLPLLRETYGDAALFVRPDDVAELATALQALPGRVTELRSAAHRLAAEDLEPAYRRFALDLLGSDPTVDPAGRTRG